MFSHWYDLAPLIIIGLLFFGTKRLPELGSSVGKTIKEFQKSMREISEPQQPSPAVAPQNLPAAIVTPVEAPQIPTTPAAPAVSVESSVE